MVAGHDPRRWLPALVLLCGQALAAQENEPPLPAIDLLSLPAELHVQAHTQIRLRAQVDAGRDLTTPAQPDLGLPLWSVAAVQIEGGDHVGGRLSLGLSGQLGEPNKLAPVLDEAYLETRWPWPRGLLQLRAGRQALQTEDPRLASEQGFLDPPERVDALRVRAGLDAMELDAAVVKLSGAQQQRADGAELMALATLAGYWGDSIEVHLQAAGLLGAALSDSDDPQIEGDQRADLQVGQLGFGLVLTPTKIFTTRAALSWQTGRARGLDVSAYDLSTRVQLRLPLRPTPSLVLGLDHSSGESARFDNHRTRFLSPLGERHDRFGAADRLAPQNASDLFVKLSLRRSNSRLELSLHRLSLADAADRWVEVGGVDRGSGDDTARLLGHELDIEGTLALLDGVDLELLYALFVPERAAGRRQGWQAAHRLLVGLRLAL